MSALARWIPALDWLRRYPRENLGGDVSAGLTVAVMLIPQGMAYAMLAGLPPIMGLYASVFPLFVYALFGTSRQLAVGPVAMVALLTATGVGTLAEAGSDRYVALAIVLAGMVGLFQLGLGLARLGKLVTLLSHPVISGFTSAAAIVIGLSQLKHLLGASIPNASRLHELALGTAAHVHETHLLTVSLGLGAMAILLAMKKWVPRVPGALVVVVLGTLLTWGLGLDARGVRIVGEVPAGLPTPSLTGFSWGDLWALLPTALAIGLVGFMESISVAKAFARKNRYAIDANQELVALGLANVAGYGFGACPVTGGFSRTAVNADAGSKTPLASMITAVAIALSLLFFTPLFHYLPSAVLAAIVMTAVIGLIDLKEPAHLWQVKRSDAVLLGLTFVVTLFVGIEEGIGAGVAGSLALFVFRSTRPHTAVLGRLPGTTDYRNLKRYAEAKELPGVRIFRFDASFYFANADYFRDQVDALLLHRAELPLHALVIDASGINDLDASAVSILGELHRRLEESGIALYFANVKGPVRDVLARGHLTEQIGEARFFLSTHAAVQAALAAAPEASPASEPAPIDAAQAAE